MKNLVKALFAVSLMIALAATGIVRPMVDQSRHTASSAIHAMVADGDIGDGTSPAKKG